ncbi:MAG: transcriptional repressor [Gammaproteobacteria bacterium]|nr:MAG: transcriptional repressor [Gammaproteobacteria bacterium]
MTFLATKGLNEQEEEKLVKYMIKISKEKGAKITTQRILIFKELVKNTKKHPSAEDIYENLKDRVYGLSLSTVYRALSAFEELGLVRRIPTPDGKAHFEIANKPHGHFICKNCGKIIDLEDIDTSVEDLKGKLHQKGLITESCNVVCYGLCNECQTNG